jgi:hypothetical protein
VGYVPEAVQGAQRPGNYVDISLWLLMGKEKNHEIYSAGVSTSIKRFVMLRLLFVKYA